MLEEILLKKKVNKIKGLMLTGLEEIKTCQNNKISLIKDKKLGILISGEEKLRNLYYINYNSEQDLLVLLIITITNKKKIWKDVFDEELDCSYIRGSLFTIIII